METSDAPQVGASGGQVEDDNEGEMWLEGEREAKCDTSKNNLSQKFNKTLPSVSPHAIFNWIKDAFKH